MHITTIKSIWITIDAKRSATTTKSSWSRSGTACPLLKLSLLLRKLPTASPINAPKPNKNPSNNPWGIFPERNVICDA